jgi:hypothetical protein
MQFKFHEVLRQWYILYGCVIPNSEIFNYGLDGRGSNPGREQDSSLLQNVQAGSGDHAPSYPMGTGGKTAEA